MIQRQWVESKFLCGGAPLWIRYVAEQGKAIPGALDRSRVIKNRAKYLKGEMQRRQQRIHVVNEIVPLSCSRSLMCSCQRPRRPWRRPEPCVSAEVGLVDVSSNVKGCWRMSRTGVAVSSPMDELWVFVVTHVSLYIRQQNMWAALNSLRVFLPLATHS